MHVLRRRSSEQPNDSAELDGIGEPLCQCWPSLARNRLKALRADLAKPHNWAGSHPFASTSDKSLTGPANRQPTAGDHNA
jgi:hypothetical protein